LRAVIFANGPVSGIDDIPAMLAPDDFLIAADGGLRHCRRLGLTPGAVVGDFDSLSADEIESMEAAGAEIHRHPAEKDETDLELALSLARSRGATEAIVIGGLGDRWDMTAANLLLPAMPAFASIRTRLVDGDQEIFYVRSGERVEIAGRPGDLLSLIPLNGDAEGVRIEGFAYPLSDETLTFGSTRGVSNIISGKAGTLFLRKGLLLCIVKRRAPSRHP
jgi:thiamine pyrophosphokinase